MENTQNAGEQNLTVCDRVTETQKGNKAMMLVEGNLITILPNGNISIKKGCGCEYIVDIKQLAFFEVGKCKKHQENNPKFDYSCDENGVVFDEDGN